MNRSRAIQEDKGYDFYVDYEESVEGWGVFGSESGFCYSYFYDEMEAEREAEEMNRRYGADSLRTSSRRIRASSDAPEISEIIVDAEGFISVHPGRGEKALEAFLESRRFRPTLKRVSQTLGRHLSSFGAVKHSITLDGELLYVQLRDIDPQNSGATVDRLESFIKNWLFAVADTIKNQVYYYLEEDFGSEVSVGAVSVTFDHVEVLTKLFPLESEFNPQVKV